VKPFENYVGIDWSGAKTPIFNKAISVSTVESGSYAPQLLSQKWARQTVAEYILDLAQNIKMPRTLIGIDCNFGYADEVVTKQFGQNATHRDVWAGVDAACIAHKDSANFFAGGFWQSPQYAPDFWISGKRRADFNMPRRETEIACSDQGLGNPESPFKLIGAKQVGKGGLAGMRMAHYLKQCAGDAIAFWPFEPDLIDTAKIVITEIYPRQFLMRSGHGTTKIRTHNDLNTVLTAFGSEVMASNAIFSDHDTDAIASAAGLRHLCQKKIPKEISAPRRMSYNAQTREGWIFGIE